MRRFLIFTLHKIFLVIKSRMRLAGNVALIAEMRNAYDFLFEKRNGRDHLQDLDLRRKIILNGS